MKININLTEFLNKGVIVRERVDLGESWNYCQSTICVNWA